MIANLTVEQSVPQGTHSIIFSGMDLAAVFKELRVPQSRTTIKWVTLSGLYPSFNIEPGRTSCEGFVQWKPEHSTIGAENNIQHQILEVHKGDTMVGLMYKLCSFLCTLPFLELTGLYPRGKEASGQRGGSKAYNKSLLMTPGPLGSLFNLQTHTLIYVCVFCVSTEMSGS